MSDYHRLSIGEKQALHRERMREPAVACPECDTQTTVADLIAHAARCSGPRDPHPGSRWVSWREALALGVTGWTLSRWASSGDVRFRGDRQDRKYLLRDIAIRMAHRRRR